MHAQEGVNACMLKRWICSGRGMYTQEMDMLRQGHACSTMGMLKRGAYAQKGGMLKRRSTGGMQGVPSKGRGVSHLSRFK